MESLKNIATNIAEFSSSFVNILDMVFKECPDGIIYKDKNLFYRTMNKTFCNCYKIENPSEFIGKKEAPFLTPENQKIVKEVSFAILKEHKPITYFLSLNDDSEKFLSVTSTPIFYQKELIGIISMIKDITYEENIKERFVLKHYQIKSLLENIPMIIYLQNRDLEYIAGTKPSKDFVDEGYDAFSNIHINLDRNKDSETEENLCVLKDNKILIKEKEVTDLKENKHWYKVFKVPMKDFNGDITGVITLANNIDAEKQLQAQRETFVASIGHDLKNPTIAQIRSLELLLKGCFGEIPSEQRDLLEMVLDSCRYMNGMLSSLLATYKNYGGIIKLNFEDFSLPELVNECVSEMIYVAKDKDVIINIDNQLVSKMVHADRVQIKRVIMNLLSNGIKYAFSNSTLNLFIYSQNKNACFEFQNDSPYISEDKQKSIFARYVSYASAHNELGIGLGLYASKKIIEGHSGIIFVQSSIENKNLFGFKIPFVQKSGTIKEVSL